MRKRLKQIIAAVVVCALLISGGRGMNYILVDDTSSYTRLMMHEFYGQDNIDILMVGASHCYRGTIPSIVRENTGKNVFNASSSRQNPDASFALIKEAVRLYKIEQIYLEMSASIATTTGQYKERTNITDTYLISDYMRPSLNRTFLLLGASSPEYYANGFWIAKRTKLQEFNWEVIAELYDKKSTDIYKNNGYDYAGNASQWYEENGHVASTVRVKKSGYCTNSADTGTIKIDDISEDWHNTILGIIDFCSKKNIRLTLYAAPVSNFQLAAEGNYDEYIAYVRNLAADSGVEYVDFNLLNEKYFPYSAANYSDSDHLNMYGAERFSRVLSDYINGILPEDAFYESVSKKLENAEPEYYGIAYLDNEEERDLRLISNYPEAFEYKIELTYDDKDPVLVQDFNSNNTLSIPYGSFTVTYRPSGSDRQIRVVTYP